MMLSIVRTAYGADRLDYERFLESIKPKGEVHSIALEEKDVIIPSGFIYKKV